MIRSILAFSVTNRYAVILVTLIANALGAWSLARLPIDAVPDVTNNQAQINAVATSLTPVEIEKQVTVLIERALAGTPGLETMSSFSRNGFAQLTAVFSDKVDVYFARAKVEVFGSRTGSDAAADGDVDGAVVIDVMSCGGYNECTRMSDRPYEILLDTGRRIQAQPITLAG